MAFLRSLRIVLPVVPGLALVLVLSSVGVAQAHEATLTSSSSYEIGHVGVAGGGYYGQVLSNGIIMFQGESLDSVGVPHRFPIYFYEIATGRTQYTGYAGSLVCFEYPHAVIGWTEEGQGDLNGDGDQTDTLDVVFDVATGQGRVFAENLRIDWSCVSSGHIAYYRIEPYDRVDYNGDGDLHDTFVFLYDIQNRTETLVDIGSGPTMHGHVAVWPCMNGTYGDLCYYDVWSNTKYLAGLSSRYPGTHVEWVTGDSEMLAFSLYENTSWRHQGYDVNGDGKLDQIWLATLDMSTGELAVHTQVGVVSTAMMKVSHGKVMAVHGYGYPTPQDKTSYFVYDTKSKMVTNLPKVSDVYYYFELHDKIALGANCMSAGPPEGPAPPPRPPLLLIFDTETGGSQTVGICSNFESGIDSFDGKTVMELTSEGYFDEDVNGDGDRNDSVIAYVTSVEGPPPSIASLALGLTSFTTGTVLLLGWIALKRRKRLGKEPVRRTDGENRESG